MNTQLAFSTAVLEIDAPSEAARIEKSIREIVFSRLKRKGVVLGLSGGIDSSVAAALCVRAMGAERVLGILMPEAECSAESSSLGYLLADFLRISPVLEDITPLLQAAGCYTRRDDAIRKVLPEYESGYKCKIVLPNLLDANAYPIYSVVVESSAGLQARARLSAESYQTIVAASNFKQRTRKMIEYFHADRLRYAVVGTPNLLEYDQGFFVKNGDGAADLKPIAHLYKTQVYQLARFLGIPREIQERQPTTDTYSLHQSQEEFFFALSHDKLDLCLYGRNNEVPPIEVAAATGLTVEQAERVYSVIDSKRRATRYQHMEPLLVEKIGEEPS